MKPIDLWLKLFPGYEQERGEYYPITFTEFEYALQQYKESIPMDAEVILQGEPLPCPFCGNEAELIEKGNNFTKKRFVTVKCTNKNCRAEMTNGAIRNDMNWLKKISTNAWNKRAGREPKSK